MATPVEQTEYDYQLPVKTEEYDYHVPVAEAVKPGFLQRFAESYGIPTNANELVGALKSASLGLISPILPIAESTVSYLGRAKRGIQEGLGEVVEAGRNVAEGGPVLANVGKAGYGLTHAYLQAAPVAGPTIETMGEDVARGNYAGAAGGAAGVMTQAAALGSPEARGKATKLSEKVAPIDPDIAYEQMGLAAQQYVAKPVQALRAEVAKHAEPLAEAVDAQYPQGSIQKSATLNVLADAVKKYFPTDTRAGFELPTGFREVVKELQSVPGEAMTWEAGKSLRSALGNALGRVGERASRAPLALAYKNLTEQMRAAAESVGMEDSFNQYNQVHRAERALGELALDDVVDAKSGVDALRALDKQKGALKIRLEDLKPYGIDPSEITSLMDAYKPGQSAKVQRSIIDHWAARHAAGALGSLLGVGFMPGYGGVLALQIAREGGRASLPQTALETGEAAAKLGRIPPPLEVPQPTIKPMSAESVTPAGPTTPEQFKERMKNLPPIATSESPTEAVEVPSSPQPEAAAPKPPTPSSPYAESQKALAARGLLNRALSRLSSGKRELSEAEWGKVGELTGLDMTKPENIGQALSALKARKAVEAAGASWGGVQEGFGNVPATATFTDPAGKSTFNIPLDQTTVGAVKSRLAQARTKTSARVMRDPKTGRMKRVTEPEEPETVPLSELNPRRGQ